MKSKGVLFLFIVLFAGGCATYRAKPLEPARTASAFEARALTDPGLQKFVGKLPDVWDLDSLTLAALYYQPELDVARAQWKEAQAAQRTAGERPNPTLSLGPEWVSHLEPGLTPWILGFNFDIPIETAGKRGARIRQAEALAETARQNLALAAWQVRSRVRASLVSTLAAQESSRILRHQEKELDENARLLSVRSASGRSSPLNAAQATILAGRNHLALEDALRQEAEARAQLADAIGVSLISLKEIHLSSASLAHLPSPDDPVLSKSRRAALVGRSDLLAALATYAASESALQLEIDKQYPDIHLGPGFTYDQGQDKWGLGVSLPLPVLNRNKGPIAEAKAHREEAAARFLDLQDKIINEVDRDLAGYRAAARKLAAADRVLADQAKQNRELQDLLRPGDVSRLTLFRSQLDIDSTALARADAYRQTQEALGALEDALQHPLAGAESIPAEVIENNPRGE